MSGDIQDKGNNRPISILPVLSILLERHAACSFNEYIDYYSLLHDSQSGFRNKHLCETAPTNIMHLWTKSMNDGLLINWCSFY